MIESNPIDDPDRTADGGGTGARSWLSRIATGALFVQRMLFGVMFVMTGTIWWRRATPPGEYLLENAAMALERGFHPIPPYDSFFNTVVLANPGLFATLAAVGELLVGVALLLGFPKRAGAVGGIFLAANYGLAFGNGLFPPSGNFLLMVLFIPLLSEVPYRVFTPVHSWVSARRNANA